MQANRIKSDFFIIVKDKTHRSMKKESGKMRKKIIVLFMTMTMAVSLFTGCGENTDAVENKKNTMFDLYMLL